MIYCRLGNIIYSGQFATLSVSSEAGTYHMARDRSRVNAVNGLVSNTFGVCGRFVWPLSHTPYLSLEGLVNVYIGAVDA